MGCGRGEWWGVGGRGGGGEMVGCKMFDVVRTAMTSTTSVTRS